MNKDFVDQIIANKTHCFIVSPHLDDAVFSAGGLISRLAGKTKVTVINVFTSCGKSNSSLSAKVFLKQCDYKSKEALFADRVKEDREIFTKLGVEVNYLDEVDALWRQKNNFPSKILGSVLPELGNVYPTYRFHISTGKVSRHDKKLIERLADKIVSLLPGDSYLVFSPIGIGKHVDHLVVRESCLSVIPRDKLIFWTDFPYLLSHKVNRNFIKSQNISAFELETDTAKKISLCKKYYSQYSQVIKDDNSLKVSEMFYRYSFFAERPATLNCSPFDFVSALISEPKDFLYNLLFGDRQKITYKLFSHNNYQDANEIIKKITSKIPQAKCHLIGSTGLKIAGQGDIDVLVESTSANVKQHTVALEKIFGPEKKSRHSLIQWKIKYKGVNVDLDLIDQSSTRFKIQKEIFDTLNSNKKLKNQYEILKYQAGSSQTFKYSVAKIIFFDKLLKNSVSPFPEYLNEYQFVQNFGEEKHFGDYQFALYKDKSDKIFFVKRWMGKTKNRAYHFLQNEVEVYKYLNSKKSSDAITIPKLIEVIEEKNCLYVILEQIEGKDLSGLTPNKKLALFEEAMSFLSSRDIQGNKYKIDQRPPTYWIAILLYITIKAILLHPALLVPILKGFYFVVSNSARLISRKQRSLIHRDFNDYNIIMGKKHNYLIDFQLASIADSIIDRVVLYLKYTFDPLMISAIKNHKSTKKIIQDPTTRTVFYSYLTIFSIYDLSLPDGSHNLSQQCLTKSINQSL